MGFLNEALKQGGLFAVAAVCLAVMVASARAFLWIYKRIADRNDVLVDRAHNKSESDMKIVAELRATVERQADVLDALVDRFKAIEGLLHRILERRAKKTEAPTDEE